MVPKPYKFILTSLLCFFLLATAFAQNRSVYTPLTTGDCKTIEFVEEEAGAYTGICPGPGGYKLEVVESDLRQSVNLVFPSGKNVPLHFYKVSAAFSSLGAKAEWRLKGNTPVAVIIRFNASEDPENPDKITSYLVVAKIGNHTACITDVVKPSKTQNQQARDLADTAAGKACKAFDWDL